MLKPSSRVFWLLTCYVGLTNRRLSTNRGGHDVSDKKKGVDGVIELSNMLSFEHPATLAHSFLARLVVYYLLLRFEPT